MAPSPNLATPGAILLNAPQPSSQSLDAALRQRQTLRAIQPRPLSPQLLSDLLWAAFGVNRRDGPFGLCGRTAGSASNSQEIDLYVALTNGVYVFDAAAHALNPIVSDDLRSSALTPGQSGVEAVAPLQIIFVADTERLVHTQGFHEPGLLDPDVQKSYSYVDAGLIAQNIYLFAAAHDLAAWFHNCDRSGLHRRLGLKASQQVLFAHSVGYPAAGHPDV